MNPDGTELTQLTHNDRSDQDPVYSADGWQIAFVRWQVVDLDEDRFHTDIYTMSADGTNETRVTSDDFRYDFSPSWSPDGKHIAFQGGYFDTNSWNIYRTSANGGKARRLTKESGATEYYNPAWSPDGKRILFNKFDPSDAKMYIVRIKPRSVGPRNRPVTLGVGIQPSWSPDSAQIAFVRGGNINKMASDGSKKKPIAQDASRPTWSPDGTKIAFNRLVEEHVDILTMNANRSNQMNLTNNSAFDRDLDPDWQPIVP
jgi:TolB protein